MEKLETCMASHIGRMYLLVSCPFLIGSNLQSKVTHGFNQTIARIKCYLTNFIYEPSASCV